MWSGQKDRLKRMVLSRLFLYVVFCLILVFLVTFHLGSSPAKFTNAETKSLSNAASIGQIVKQAANAPHAIVVLAMSHSGGKGTFAIRAVSVLFALLFGYSFFSISRSLFGTTIGLFSSLLFISTPAYLAAARSATAYVMLLSFSLLIALYFWFLRTKRDADFPLVILLIATALSLYIPGLIWLVSGSFVVCRRKFKERLLSATKPAIAAAGLLALLAIVPLILALINDWTIIKNLALIPDKFPSPLGFLKNIVWACSSLFVKLPHKQSLALGRLPYLDIVQTILLIFGVYALWLAAKSKAAALVAGIILVILLAALNSNMTILLLALPQLGIFFAAGLRYLYIEWRGVFPKNPIARALAMLLICSLLAVQLFFGARYSLIALPRTSDTSHSDMLK